MSNLRQLDLNLLLTLDVLLTEHNVTRAAQRLHLSQPTVSVQLAKLRAFFNDPLLLPGARGMQPTARADTLREPLRKALASLELAVLPASPFNPALATNTWNIAASDYSAATILLPLVNRLRRVAPGTRLASLAMVPADIAGQAERREIDLAFHISADAPTGLRRRMLFKERYVLTGRVEHPRLKKPLTLATFNALEYAIVSPDGGGFHGITDDVLLKSGLTRRVALSVPHFMLALSALERTDLVAMLPWRLVSNNPALQIVEPPIEVPGFEMCMLWHERSHRDPAHQWLREFIADAMQ
ncbi:MULTISPECIES: LysR family transcriptional regulator [unclassified Brenneria]|uniref:LysR family transcriptional regulator n=1 Tax=unclassified Brenneria TaxID=2634434 RepID=UPI0015520E0C|nr:LysR family transcriptional regulator [Brenneria sp. hezel4-2-4]MEE3652938.1 LysR family transcriptional regulator [Brenneria sp. HEZEL_4_2_4]NPD02892.1 LysR family transcriptional regulator [Brenneria sp. hezel4-2-4]